MDNDDPCGRELDEVYIVSVELRMPHPVAYEISRRAEKAFELKTDAIVTYEAVLTALQTLEAFSE